MALFPNQPNKIILLFISYEVIYIKFYKYVIQTLFFNGSVVFIDQKKII